MGAGDRGGAGDFASAPMMTIVGVWARVESGSAEGTWVGVGPGPAVGVCARLEVGPAAGG
jgi:hypothetical protein